MDLQILQQLKLKLEVKGLYSLPEEWKLSDEKDPSLFTYIVRLQNIKIQNGRYQQRQLTEQEIKEQEELMNKNKKASQKGQVINPAEEQQKMEEERLRLEKEKAEQEEWDSLDDETKFIRGSESKYKSPMVLFNIDVSNENKETNNVQEKTLEDKQLIIFEERVLKDKGEWIYLIKEPNMTKEEVEKLKKSKPKNINLNDLNAVYFRGWVDYSQFEQGQLEFEQRVELTQVFPFYKDPNEIPAEIPRPALQRTYLYLSGQINQSFRLQEKQRSIHEFLLKASPEHQDPKDVKAIKELMKNFEIIYQSLAIEYSNQFGKELNNQQEQYYKQMGKPKHSEGTKRRELFLYNFNISGKYKVLKDRIKKQIVNICKAKFNKTGSITGINADNLDQDQFYSQIFTFLMQQMRVCLDQVIQNQKEKLHEDVLPQYQQTLIERDTFLENYTNKEKFQSYKKLAQESELLNDIVNSEKYYNKIIELRKKDPQQQYEFCKFYCRQHKYLQAQEAILESLKYDENNADYLLMNALLLAQRGKGKDSVMFMRYLQQHYQQNRDNEKLMLIYALMGYIYEHEMGNKPESQQQTGGGLAQKWWIICERVQMRIMKKIPDEGNFKECPEESELPLFNEDEESNAPVLDETEKDEMIAQIVDYLNQQNQVKICQKMVTKITNPSNKIISLQAQILAQNNQLDEALELLNNLIQSSPSDVYLLKLYGDICFNNKKFEEAYDKYIEVLKKRNSSLEEQFELFIKLANIRLNQKMYSQSVIFYTKAAQIDVESPKAFNGLGQSYLGYGDLESAEDALIQANLLDPLDLSTWFYLIMVCIKKNDFIRSNQSVREFLKIKGDKYHMIIEIADLYIQNQQFNLALQLLQKYIRMDQIRNMQQYTQIYGKMVDCVNKVGSQDNIKELVDNMSKEIGNLIEQDATKSNHSQLQDLLHQLNLIREQQVS